VKRVLLDGNVAHALRKHLSNHETVTAAYAGFAGLKNGELLKAAVESGFDILATGDKTLQYEQNLSGDKIAVVSLSANGWRIIAPYVAKIAATPIRNSIQNMCPFPNKHSQLWTVTCRPTRPKSFRSC